MPDLLLQSTRHHERLREHPLVEFCRARAYRVVVYVDQSPSFLRGIPDGGFLLVNGESLEAEALPLVVREGDTLCWIPGAEA